MSEESLTNQELINENMTLRQRIRELETLQKENSQVQEALRASEKKYRLLFMNAPTAIYEVDYQKRRFLGFNEIILSITGYTEEELWKMDPWDFFTEESQKIFQERMKLMQEGAEIASSQEYSIKKKDGSVLWLNASVDYTLENGRPVRAQVVAHDITERRQIGQALREKEELYTRLVDSIPDVILHTDLNGRILFINDYSLKISGYCLEEILGRSVLHYLAVEDREKLVRNSVLMLEQRVPPQEYHLIVKDGRKIPFEINGDVLWNMEGAPFGFVHVCRDISERKQAEETIQKQRMEMEVINEELQRTIWIMEESNIRLLAAQQDIIRINEQLQQSEEKFSKAFHLGPFILTLSDPASGRYVEVSDHFLKMSEYSREEVIGHTSVELNNWISLEDRDRVVSTLMNGGVVLDEEIQFCSRSGKNYIMLFSAEIITIMNKPHLVSAAIDVTDRRRAAKEKQSLEERLNRAQKMEALGQMAGGVAHDLNNVLGVLSGYSELLLLELPEGRKARGLVEKILQSTEKGAAIIQDMLTLARRGVANADVINLNNIIAGFLISPVLEKIKDYHPGVIFRTENEPNLLNIKGSPVHLEKTLMNLVSNAVESITSEGEVTIRTENRYLDKPIKGYDEIKEGDYAVLIVSDTGMGIPPEHREKLFEPFFTKKTMGRSGTGLGLAIVWGTVKDHSGYIDLQTADGQGSSFALYFPVTREELTAPRQKKTLEQYMGQGESVLVVDDIAEQREVASGLLKKLGYQVHAVSGGEEAVEYLQHNKADILVLDMIMTPGIDGLETYRRVLQINPRQKAILVSGFSETDRVLESHKLGAGAYVHKPYVMEKIGLAIRNELNRKEVDKKGG